MENLQVEPDEAQTASWQAQLREAGYIVFCGRDGKWRASYEPVSQEYGPRAAYSCPIFEIPGEVYAADPAAINKWLCQI